MFPLLVTADRERLKLFLSVAWTSLDRFAASRARPAQAGAPPRNLIQIFVPRTPPSASFYASSCMSAFAATASLVETPSVSR
jgi:hypothetical protein